MAPACPVLLLSGYPAAVSAGEQEQYRKVCSVPFPILSWVPSQGDRFRQVRAFFLPPVLAHIYFSYEHKYINLTEEAGRYSSPWWDVSITLFVEYLHFEPVGRKDLAATGGKLLFREAREGCNGIIPELHEAGITGHDR